MSKSKSYNLWVWMGYERIWIRSRDVDWEMDINEAHHKAELHRLCFTNHILILETGDDLSIITPPTTAYRRD